MATTIPILGTWGGLGATTVYDPKKGRYTITTNATTRFGKMTAGLLEEADATGIASGYRVIKKDRVSSSGTEYSVICTTNGTGTKMYHKTAAASSWTDFTPAAGTPQTDFGANVATDMVVLFSDFLDKDAVIVGFGTTKEWYYSEGVGTTWVKNGLAAERSEFMTKAYIQETGLATARMIYAVSPAASLTMTGTEVYTVTDVNGTPTGKTTIAPGLSDYVTSIAENDLGDIFIGTRNKLYSFDENGLPVVVAGPFADPPTDAGGQSDRRNFEAYVQLPDSSMLYVVEGYSIIRVRSAADPITERMPDVGPRSRVDVEGGIPRLELPVSAIARAGDWVICALTADTSKFTLANQPGGTTLLQNTLTNAVSELYVGKLVNGELVWWGSELTCTDRLRYMWYEAANNYLYLCSGDSESVNVQQKRCYFFLTDPYGRLISSAIKLSAGTPIIEFPPFDIGGEYEPKGGGLITIDAQSLTSTTTCTVAIRPQPDYDTSSTFTTLAVFSSAAVAERGVHVGRSVTFDKLRVKVTLGAGSGTAFPRFNGGTVTLHPLRERQSVGAI